MGPDLPIPVPGDERSREMPWVLQPVKQAIQGEFSPWPWAAPTRAAPAPQALTADLGWHRKGQLPSLRCYSQEPSPSDSAPSSPTSLDGLVPSHPRQPG